MSKSKKKFDIKNYISMVFFLIIGGVCGIFIGRYCAESGIFELSPGAAAARIILLLLAFYAVFFLQLVIHEAGHLVFGLLTGYRFLSFRIANVILIKENGRLKIKKFSLAGTGGQCLLAPPDMNDGKIPYVLYNLGGSIFNAVLGFAFLILYFFVKDFAPAAAALIISFSVIGFGFALMNGVPMRLGAIDNDGHNAFSLGKNPEAMRSFWIQMKSVELTAAGVRMKDMPQDWFSVPDGEGMKNSMTCVLGVMACNRLMDEKNFSQADLLIKKLLSEESKIVGVHRRLMLCDRIFCEVIGENRPEVIQKLLDKEQKSFMKSMKAYPSVIRTEYAIALLCDKDEEKAEKIKALFNKRAVSYPYPADIESERELIEIADKARGEL
ncbi:MAG: hypothetical protein ACI4JG_06890 [Acutalibacteraceae bacterium]